MIIIWFAYSDVGTGRFPSLLRNVVTDATVYFTMAMCIQTLVLFFLSFADVRRRPLPILTLLTRLLPAHDESVSTYVRTLSPDLKSLTNLWDLVASIQCEFPWKFRCYVTR